jgi:hypothetical protein
MRAKVSEVVVNPEAEETEKECCSVEEQIRLAAYYNWENATGGNPVDEEAARQFWLEAEEQFKPQSE